MEPDHFGSGERFRFGAVHAYADRANEFFAFCGGE
jgi:hypothetical protein